MIDFNMVSQVLLLLIDLETYKICKTRAPAWPRSLPKRVLEGEAAEKFVC